MRITVQKCPGGVFDVIIEPPRRVRYPVTLLRALLPDEVEPAVKAQLDKIEPYRQERLPRTE